MIAPGFKAPASAYRIQLEANRHIDYRRQLHRGVAAALDRGEQKVVIDCASWSELDLILLSTLVTCASACDEQGAAFELQNLESNIESRIKALRLGERLGLRSS